ncbi:hypothetical protein NDU88_002985 [Pleurodeles waltl]|uniref:Uncharacterized protein n=1 Tax=Pleurodeles waltl TaxID=8319 RepID=A0AAV7L4X7_PLEWA|nr:hypothetical protein NDU88_002985 [Pleurodeles waltl]
MLEEVAPPPFLPPSSSGAWIQDWGEWAAGLGPDREILGGGSAPGPELQVSRALRPERPRAARGPGAVLGGILHSRGETRDRPDPATPGKGEFPPFVCFPPRPLLPPRPGSRRRGSAEHLAQKRAERPSVARPAGGRRAAWQTRTGNAARSAPPGLQVRNSAHR